MTASCHSTTLDSTVNTIIRCCDLSLTLATARRLNLPAMLRITSNIPSANSCKLECHSSCISLMLRILLRTQTVCCALGCRPWSHDQCVEAGSSLLDDTTALIYERDSQSLPAARAAVGEQQSVGFPKMIQ